MGLESLHERTVCAAEDCLLAEANIGLWRLDLFGRQQSQEPSSQPERCGVNASSEPGTVLVLPLCLSR